MRKEAVIRFVVLMAAMAMIAVVSAFSQKPAPPQMNPPMVSTVTVLPVVNVTPEEKNSLSLLKVQIERNNAQLRSLQAQAEPFIADNQKKQATFNKTMQQVLDRYAAENPQFVAAIEWDGDNPLFTGTKKPEKKDETKPATPPASPAPTAPAKN